MFQNANNKLKKTKVEKNTKVELKHKQNCKIVYGLKTSRHDLHSKMWVTSMILCQNMHITKSHFQTNMERYVSHLLNLLIVFLSWCITRCKSI
jgi:hypothetical protein